MTVGVHVCRGNYKGMYLSEGGYDSVAEKFFGRTNVDHFLLEFDTPRAGGFAPLRFVPENKGVVLGPGELEDAGIGKMEVLRRRTDEATRYIDAARLAISPQCGFASTMGGNPVTEADERAKLRLCVRRCTRDLAMTVYALNLFNIANRSEYLAYSKRSAREVQAHGGRVVALGKSSRGGRGRHQAAPGDDPGRVGFEGSLRQLLQRSEARRSPSAPGERQRGLHLAPVRPPGRPAPAASSRCASWWPAPARRACTSPISQSAQHPDWQIRVVEQNRADSTFGFGVVFSDRALEFLRGDDAGDLRPHHAADGDLVRHQGGASRHAGGDRRHRLRRDRAIEVAATVAATGCERGRDPGV